MPIPSRKKDEDKSKFMSRCMGDSIMKKEYPDESQRSAICMGKSKGAYIYEDPKTGELYHYKRKGIYKKNGRTLLFVKQTKGDTMAIDFIKEADEFLKDKNDADDKAGYPPNCNEGYVEKDGKCVPVEKKE